MSSEEGIKKLSFKQVVRLTKDFAPSYFRTKVSLALLESKEAASIIKKKILFAVCTSFFFFISYLLFLTSLILFFGSYLKGKVGVIEPFISPTLFTTLFLLIIHGMLGLVFLIPLIKKTTLFEMSKSEIEQDKLWLQKIKSSSKN